MPDPGKTSEKGGNADAFPHGARFAEILIWLMNYGVSPTGSPCSHGRRWTVVAFAEATGATDRAVRFWRSGQSVPSDFATIERVLFGDNSAYEGWRTELWNAYLRARGARSGDEGRPGSAESEDGEPIERPAPDFIGRELDITKILDVLLAPGAMQAVLLQGPPGIGKTEITKVVAHDRRVIERFGENRRWFVKLETATAASLFQNAVASAIRVDRQGGFKNVLNRLKEQPGLLVLDNLETPWEPKEEREQTEATLAALAAIPGVALLASFRGRERVGGPTWALVHPVDRLPAPLDEQLFCRIAGASLVPDPCFGPFVKALDGLPLAIELVARRAFGRAELADLWEQWLAVGARLAVHRDYDPSRLKSLPHSIELSLASQRIKNTPSAERLFRLLGQLPAGLHVEDRDHFLGRSEGFEAQELLLNLGLVVERGMRLDMLSPIREFARRERTPQLPDSLAWPARYLDLIKRLGEAIGTERGSGAVERLKPEFANISGAIKGLLSTRLDEAVSTLEGLRRYTCITAVPAPILNEIAAACQVGGFLQWQASCIQSLGVIALRHSDHEGAHQAFNQALSLYRRMGDIPGEASCIRKLGEVADSRSDYEEASRFYEQALALDQDLGNMWGQANCLKGLGDIALVRQDFEGSRQRYEQALPLYRQVGDLLGEANCMKWLGDIALARHDSEEAHQAYTQALPLYRQVGDVLGEANCIQNFGRIALDREDLEGAHEAYEQALLLYRQVRDVLGEANSIKFRGDCLLYRNEIKEARRAFEQARLLYIKLKHVLGEAHCICRFAEIADYNAEHDEARTAYEQALFLYQKIEHQAGVANCKKALENDGFHDIQQGSLETAFERRTKKSCL